MKSQTRDFTLRGYLEIMRRQRVLILLVTLTCGAVALGASLLQKPTYDATSSLAVSDPSQGLALLGGAYVSGQTPLQLASVAAPQVTRNEVVARVKRALNSPLGLGQLRSAVNVAIDPNSYLVNITASNRSATKAATLANAFATADSSLTTAEARAQYRAQAAAVKSQLRHVSAASPQALTTAETFARLKSLGSVATPMTVSTTANVPSSPSSPKPVRNTVAALLFGLLLGIALATARDTLDRRLRHSSDVSQVLDHPVVGHIRSEALGHAGPPVEAGPGVGGPLADPDEEAFRILRQNVQYLSAASETETLLVTSAMAEEGKSTVAACLAVTMAESGRRTLLVDCDLRRPVLARRFGISESPGLTDYLSGNAGPDEILQSVPMPTATSNGNGLANPQQMATNLVCITSGTTVPRPAELLASERFQAFLAEVSKAYDLVVLDTAPLLPVADTLGIIPSISTLLVCVRLARTTRDQARAAQSALDRLPERPVGLVLTDVREDEDGYYGYYAAPTPASV